MTFEQALNRLRQIIRYDLRHKGYKRTIALRNFYLQCITGEKIDSLLPQFERQESPDLWKQRKKLTIENLSPALAPVLNKFFKVGRLPVNERWPTITNKKKLDLLKKQEDTFYADSDVADYLTNVIDDVAQFDPNAFLVMDFYGFDPAGVNGPNVPTPYPALFHCDDVLDFRYTDKGTLDYLVTHHKFKVYAQGDKDKVQEADLVDYWIYVAGYSIRFYQVHEFRTDIPTSAVQEQFERGLYAYKINRTGSVKVTDQIQAKRIGYIQDKSEKTICVSPFHKATPILRDLIRHKSNYDLSMLLHVFPKLFQYGDLCEGEGGARKCDGGTIAGTKDKCKSCGGTGFKPQSSAQEYILLKRPKNKDEGFLPLKDLAYYLSPDLNVVDKLKAELLDLARQVFIAVFSTDLMSYTTGPKASKGSENTTATFTTEKKEDINDALLPYAQQRANLQIFILSMMGIFQDIELTAIIEYPKKLEVESLEELLGKLKAYSESNVSELLIDEVESQIARIQLENDPEKIKRYNVINRFRPFRGKTEAIKIELLASNLVPRTIKTLYSNLAWIFDRIEADYEGKLEKFYDASYKDQWNTIKTILDEMTQEAKKDEEAAIPLLPRPGGVNPTNKPVPAAA